MKKLNILDLIIIFVIIFVLAFGVSRIFFFGKSSGSDNAKNASKIISDEAVATTTFEIKKLKNIAADAISDGVSCYDDKGNYMGEIKEVTKKIYDKALEIRRKYGHEIIFLQAQTLLSYSSPKFLTIICIFTP